MPIRHVSNELRVGSSDGFIRDDEVAQYQVTFSIRPGLQSKAIFYDAYFLIKYD